MRWAPGFMFVLMLLFTMVVEACQAGLPAIGDGEFAIVGFTDMCTLLPPLGSLCLLSVSSPCVPSAALPSALKSAWLEELVERRGCRCCCAVSFAATISTIAFAFYIQPIAMPMLREMPPGKLGYDVLAWSMRLVIMGASSRPSLPSHPCS